MVVLLFRRLPGREDVAVQQVVGEAVGALQVDAELLVLPLEPLYRVLDDLPRVQAQVLRLDAEIFDDLVPVGDDAVVKLLHPRVVEVVVGLLL